MWKWVTSWYKSQSDRPDSSDQTEHSGGNKTIETQELVDPAKDKAPSLSGADKKNEAITEDKATRSQGLALAVKDKIPSQIGANKESGAQEPKKYVPISNCLDFM